MTRKQTYYKRLFLRFMSDTDFQYNRKDWNSIMGVADKIAGIIGHEIDLLNEVSLVWWYNKKKNIFDSITGKYYKIVCYFYNPPIKRLKPNAENKKEATWFVMQCFVEWYNNNVKQVVIK